MTKKKGILVVDIGGTNVKLMMSPDDKRKFESGPKLDPKQTIAAINATAAGWEFDRISIGFPSLVKAGRIARDPKHLAKGWVGFDFQNALGKPTRVINDAAMQALGSYDSGRMLFLGLGTGLGSALIWDNNLLPLELGDLPFGDGATIEDHVGKRGLDRFGKKVWQREVETAVLQLKLAFIADHVVLGGGNVKQFQTLPKGIEGGNNRNAYLGGCRLWDTQPRSKRPKWTVIS